MDEKRIRERDERIIKEIRDGVQVIPNNRTDRVIFILIAIAIFANLLLMLMVVLR